MIRSSTESRITIVGVRAVSDLAPGVFASKKSPHYSEGNPRPNRSPQIQENHPQKLKTKVRKCTTLTVVHRFRKNVFLIKNYAKMLHRWPLFTIRVLVFSSTESKKSTSRKCCKVVQKWNLTSRKSCKVMQKWKSTSQKSCKVVQKWKSTSRKSCKVVQFWKSIVATLQPYGFFSGTSA